MLYLVRRLLAVFLLLLAVVGTSWVSYRCGHRQGLADAPRYHYGLDVTHELKTNPLFREYVIGIYGREFRMAIDSVLATKDVADVFHEWLRREAPVCNSGVSSASAKPERVPTKADYEKVFFKNR